MTWKRPRDSSIDNLQPESYIVESDNAPVLKAQVLDSGVGDEFLASKVFDNFAITIRGITGEENDGQVQGLDNGFRTSTGEGSRPQHQAIVSALTADGKDVDTVAIPQGEGIQASQEAGIVSAKTAGRQAIDVDDLIRHTRYLTVLMEELCTEDFLKFVRSITLRMENLNAIRLGLCIRGITIESHVLDLPANFTEWDIRKLEAPVKLKVGTSRTLWMQQKICTIGMELVSVSDFMGVIESGTTPRLPDFVTLREKNIEAYYYAVTAGDARFPLWNRKLVSEAFPHKTLCSTVIASLAIMSDHVPATVAGTETQLKMWREETGGEWISLRRKDYWSSEEDWC